MQIIVLEIPEIVYVSKTSKDEEMDVVLEGNLIFILT